MRRRAEAVLFDFDGVIADTENVHVAAWQRTMARMGWELTDEAAARSAEIDDRVFLEEMFGRRKVERADLDGWLRLKQALAEALLADAPRLYPGVDGLVRALLVDGVRLGVVSGTWRRNVEIVLDAAGLLDAFEVLIGKEDVLLQKPAPDGYRLALDRLRLDPGRAVAIEDSPTGLEAATCAGIVAVAVGHRRPECEWSSGLRFLTDLTSTRSAIEALLFS